MPTANGITAITRNAETITSTGASQVDQPVGVARDQVFLGDQLDRVGDRLEQAQRPDPVGPDPVLKPRGHLPLEPDHVGHDAREHAEEARPTSHEAPAESTCRRSSSTSLILREDHRTQPSIAIFTSRPLRRKRRQSTLRPTRRTPLAQA